MGCWGLACEIQHEIADWMGSVAEDKSYASWVRKTGVWASLVKLVLAHKGDIQDVVECEQIYTGTSLT